MPVISPYTTIAHTLAIENIPPHTAFLLNVACYIIIAVLTVRFILPTLILALSVLIYVLVWCLVTILTGWARLRRAVFRTPTRNLDEESIPGDRDNADTETLVDVPSSGFGRSVTRGTDKDEGRAVGTAASPPFITLNIEERMPLLSD
ncbi:hypothetical protein BV25DRAFT_1831438, partial [Artomyces pyxidatus]